MSLLSLSVEGEKKDKKVLETASMLPTMRLVQVGKQILVAALSIMGVLGPLIPVDCVARESQPRWDIGGAL